MDIRRAMKIINDPCIMLSASQVSEVKSLLAEALREIDQLKKMLERAPAPQEVGGNSSNDKEGG